MSWQTVCCGPFLHEIFSQFLKICDTFQWWSCNWPFYLTVPWMLINPCWSWSVYEDCLINPQLLNLLLQVMDYNSNYMTFAIFLFTINQHISFSVKHECLIRELVMCGFCWVPTKFGLMSMASVPNELLFKVKSTSQMFLLLLNYWHNEWMSHFHVWCNIAQAVFMWNKQRWRVISCGMEWEWGGYQAYIFRLP